MYERNAIVLERYFYQLFDFKNSSNLKENYYNYRKLFECYGNLCDAKERERISQEEFDVVSKEVSRLQKTQEKLYNKGAKFEYSRYVIFNNISETTENIEKHLQKVNDDVQKNSEELKELGQKFVQTVEDYNEKEKTFKDAVIQREKAQEDYDNAYKEAKECYEGITEEKIQMVQSFIDSENKDIKKELQSIFEDNGKNEKNQFDQDVISNTINKSIDIYKGEMDVYLAGFDRISKLFEEIETDSLKIDKHTKYYRDSRAKVDFLNAEKNYIIQFLDNERIGAIYDKKVHRKLMLEACKKFVLDFAQIDSLYEIILKEVAGRSTKKIYKENYNKEYLVELENSSIEPSLDTGKMRQEAIAFMNLNYWRVEGMRNVYSAFENIVTEIYGKDLSEFVPEELRQLETEENNVESEEVEELDVESIEQDEEIVVSSKKHRKVYYSSKIVLANAIYHSLQTREFATSSSDDSEEEYSHQEEQYSVPEDVKEILANVEEDNTDEDEEMETVEADESEENSEVFETEEIDDTENVENIEFENIEAEEEKLEEENYQSFEKESSKKENNVPLDNALNDLYDSIFNVKKEEKTVKDEVNVDVEYADNSDVEDDDKNIQYIEDDIEDIEDIEDLDDTEIEEDESVFEDTKEEYNIDDEDVDDEESILEIYYSENNNDEKKNTTETIKKKAGFFQKLVGLNAKEKKKA